MFQQINETLELCGFFFICRLLAVTVYLLLANAQRHMVSGVVFTCLFVVCFTVRVFLVRFVAQSSTNFASMPVGEEVSTGATPAVLQSVLFPSKLETQGNLASNWKRFRRVWSNYEVASRLVKQPKEERTATLLTCIGADALEIVDGLNFANEDERKDIDVVLEKLEVFCVGKTNEISERYQFNKRDQESGESIDSYVAALRTLAKTCIMVHSWILLFATELWLE